MSLTKYLIILGFCTFLCWVALFSVLFFINPIDAGFLAFLFFYISLGLALIGTFSLIGTLIRYFVKQDEMAHKQVSIAGRQSLLFAALVIIALFLQGFRFLAWWNLLVLIAVAGAVELFFISYKKFNK